MEIFINGQKTSFELENEKTAYDIVVGINEFANSSEPQHYVTNIIINNKDYSQDNESELKKVAIDQIEKIEIETTDIYGLTSISINHITSYLQLLKNMLGQKNPEDSLSTVHQSVDWMKEGVAQILKIFDPEGNHILTEKKSFEVHCDSFKEKIENNQGMSASIAEELITHVDGMNDSIQKMRVWLVESMRLPDREYITQNLTKMINEIEEIIPELQNVTFLLQTGDDKESMQIVQKLTNILEGCIGLFVMFKESFKIHMDKYTVKEAPFEEFFKVLTNNLKDLMDAIQNNDSVMIGDLLEYEFVPNIEEIKSILIKIKEEAFEKAN